MDLERAIDQLLEVIPGINRNRARHLIDEAGSVEDAIMLGTSAGGASAGGPRDALSQLRAVLGGVSDANLRKLLSRTHGNAEAAANLFWEQATAANDAPPGPAAGPQRPAPMRAAPQPQSQSSSLGDDGSRLDAAAAGQPSDNAGQGRGASQLGGAGATGVGGRGGAAADRGPTAGPGRGTRPLDARGARPRSNPRVQEEYIMISSTSSEDDGGNARAVATRTSGGLAAGDSIWQPPARGRNRGRAAAGASTRGGAPARGGRGSRRAQGGNRVAAGGRGSSGARGDGPGAALIGRASAAISAAVRSVFARLDGAAPGDGEDEEEEGPGSGSMTSDSDGQARLPRARHAAGARRGPAAAGGQRDGGGGSGGNSSGSGSDDDRPFEPRGGIIPSDSDADSSASSSSSSSSDDEGLLGAASQLYDRPLDTATLCLAKMRQPALPFPASQLPLPLKEHRRPDAEGGSLFCQDASKVPEAPITVLKVPEESTFAVRLGTLRLPLMPHTRGHSNNEEEGDKSKGKGGKGGAGKSRGEFELEVVASRLRDGSLPITALMPLFRDETPHVLRRALNSCIAVPLDNLSEGPWAKQLHTALKEAGDEPFQFNWFDRDRATDNYRSGMLLGQLPSEHSVLYNALHVLTDKLPPASGREQPLAPRALDIRIEKITTTDGEVLSERPPAPERSFAGMDAAGAHSGQAAGAAAGSKQIGKQNGKQNGKQKSAGKAKGSKGQEQEGGSAEAAADAAAVPEGKGKRKRSASDTAAGPVTSPSKRRKGAALKGPLYLELAIYARRKLFELLAAPGDASSSLVPEDNQDASQADKRRRGRAGGGGPNQRTFLYGNALATVCHALLTLGNGLWVGPDSDGILNYMEGCEGGPLPLTTTSAVRAAAGRRSSKSEAADGGAAGPSNGMHADAAASAEDGAEDASAAAAAAAAQWAGNALVQEAASLVLPELSRIRAHLASARDARNAAQGQVRSTQTKLRKYKEEDHGDEYRSMFGHVFASMEERELRAAVIQAQYRLTSAQTTFKGAEAAAQMMERVADTFAQAGLCEPPPPAPAPPQRAAGGAGRGRGGPGTSQAQAQEGADNAEAGTSAAGAAAAAADAAAEAELGDGAREGDDGAGPSTSAAAAAANADANGGAAAAAHKVAAAAAAAARPMPLPPNVPISMVLAAEAVAGKQLLLRDVNGWIRVMPPEDGGDGAGKERLPSRAFGVQELLNSVHLPAGAPEAATPPAIKSVPKRFQLQGLAWMRGREADGDAVGRGLMHLHPSWVQLVTASGFVLYMHRQHPFYITTAFFPAPVGGTCGGFLCDEMGLGKSLQSLMLVISHPPPPGWATAPGTHYDVPEGPHAVEPVPIRATLLVVPNNLVGQWQDEIERHVMPGALKWALYEGVAGSSTSARQLGDVPVLLPEEGEDNEGGEGLRRSRRKRTNPASAADGSTGDNRQLNMRSTRMPFVSCKVPSTNQKVPISECDLVIMSYEVLRRELSQVTSGRNGEAGSVLQRYGFWRIMLDEAQLVANSNSVAAQMASSLWRRHAWVVTGTPITARLNEIQGLCEFLAYEPLYRMASWRHLLQLPFQARTQGGLLAMRALLRGLMLRRSKLGVEEQLCLPPCSREDRGVVLSRVERTFYDALRKDFLQAMVVVQRNMARQAQHSLEPEQRKRRGQAVSKAMALLTSLRQCCCHPHIVKRKDAGGKRERLSMRQIMSRLVLQAYSSLDQAVAQWFSARMLLAAAEDMQDMGAAEPRLRSLAEELQLNVGLARERDPRRAAVRRLMGGEVLPKSEEQLKDDQEREDAEMAAALAAADGQVVGGSHSQHQQQGQVQTGGAVAETGVSSATAGSGQGVAAVTEGGTNATGGPSAGGAPSSSAPAGGAADVGGGAVQADGAADGQGQAQAQGGQQEEEEEEETAKELSEAARARLQRWQRLETERLTLIAYVIRKMHPQAGALVAALAASSAPAAAAGATATGLQAQAGTSAAAEAAAAATAAAEAEAGPSKRAHSEQEDADAPAGPSGAATVGRASKRTRFADGTGLPGPASGGAAGPSDAAGGSLAVPAGLSAEAAAAALAEATDQDLTVAERLRGTTEALNAQRLSLGLAPVLDVDLAELRRSRRRVERAARGAPATKQNDDTVNPDDLEAILDAHEEDDDDWLSDDSEDGGARRQAKKRAATKRRGKGKGSKAAALKEPESAMEMFLRSDPIVRALAGLQEKKHPVQSAQHEVERTAQAMGRAWHELQHLLHREAETLAAAATGGADGAEEDAGGGDGNEGIEAGAGPSAQGVAGPSSAAGAGAAGGAGTSAGGGREAAEAAGPGTEGSACPICLDEPERRTVTSCGHWYCSDCIHEIVGSGSGAAPCPICRKPLKKADLFDTVTEAEAVAMREADRINKGANAEYGAKVSELLRELSDMASADNPSASPPLVNKAVVFSSWGRLLRLVGEALDANGVPYASLLVPSLEARQAEIHRFAHDPSCRVLLLLMSTQGGAAGLTLTAASTAFILEPVVNPGLEAQAAARIYRLGQQRPTRVIRLLADDTVEQRVLALQKHKLLESSGAAVGDGLAGAARPQAAARRRGGGANAAGAAAEGGEGAGAALVSDVDPGMLVRFFLDV